MEEESHCSIALSNPICQEDPTHSTQGNNEEDSFILSSTTTDDDEYVETLVSRETSFDRTANGSSSDALPTFARSDCVAWILRMKFLFGFRYQTAYLAVTCFDRFFLRLTIDEGKTWAIKLLSAACLSLAAKMEECRPPALSEYTIDGYGFGSGTIRRMELLVLSTLEWRMSSVTPFAYFDYFKSKLFCDKGSMDLCSKATAFIFAIIEARNSLDYRPSTVALAAILAAADDQLTKKSVKVKMRLISLPESLDFEHVFSCYTLMIHELQKRKLKQPKLLDSSERSTDSGSDVDNSIVASNN